MNVYAEHGVYPMIDDLHQLILDSRGTFIKSLADADNLDYRTILTEQNNMKKIDDILQEKLLKKLDKLNKKIAWIGNKDLRGKLDFHATEMYKLIIQDSNEEN